MQLSWSLPPPTICTSRARGAQDGLLSSSTDIQCLDVPVWLSLPHWPPLQLWLLDSNSHLTLPFGYPVDILNITCPKTELLISLQSHLHWSLLYFSKWQLPLQVASAKKISRLPFDSCFFYTPHLSYQQFHWGPSKPNLFPPLCCCHSGSSHHRLSPRLLRWPPNYSTCFHPCPPTLYFQLSSQTGSLLHPFYASTYHLQWKPKPWW